jgi:hypothetical protein
MLSKESAAIIPFAILLFAGYRSGRGAMREAWPWLALAAAYLAWRRFMFGSALTVYGGTSPLASALSLEYWRHSAQAIPTWLGQLFNNHPLFPVVCVLTAAQLAIVVAGWPREARGRAALLATGVATLLTVGLFLPHVAHLPPNGIGGRLLYQTAAMYGIFSAVALLHVRWPRALWSVTIALAAGHALVQQVSLERWLEAERQTRTLVQDLRRVHAALGPDRFALVIVPGPLNGVPFAGNAQAGLMLPPIQPEPLTHRLLVQLDEELPELAQKLADGVVPTLRRGTVFDFVEGRRVRTPQVEYPTDVVCWDSRERRLAPLAVPAAATPAQWAAGLRQAFDASPCTPSPRFADVRPVPTK